MSKSNTTETNVLKLILNATAWANIADNAASGPLTNLYFALHTADPGEAGDQSTSEIAYTGYARQAIARTTGGWSVASGVGTLLVNVDFPEMTGGAGGTVTHVSVGVASSGSTAYLYSGAASPNIAVATGVTPRIKLTTTTITED